MGRSRGDKFSSLFALAFFIAAGIISFNYISNISADIEQEAAVSPFKSTDFSSLKNFSDSTWTAFTNLGDTTAKISGGKLKIINYGDVYSTMLSQPVILSAGNKYKITINYTLNESTGFSVRYGLVSNNLIGQPIFSRQIDSSAKEASFEYEARDITPISFQYFRILGIGEFDLKKITIEEISNSQTATNAPTISSPTATPVPQTTSTATFISSETQYQIDPGWNLFGSDKAIDSKTFTNFGLSVYTTGKNGWEAIKPSDKDTNFVINAGTGVYVLNETDSPIAVTLLESNRAITTEAVRGWNILYNKNQSDYEDINISLDEKQTSIKNLMASGEMSKYAYLAETSEPTDLTKVNLQKYNTIEAGKIVWVYLF